MDLAELIRGRRSVRKFKSTPLPREVVERIMELALWAPSAGDMQQYYFVVVQGEKREEIQRIIRGAIAEIRSICEEEFPNRPDFIEELMEFYRGYGGAPVLVLAYAGRMPSGEDDQKSVVLALQNLFLAAYEAGLGSNWAGFAGGKEAEINACVGVEDRKLMGVIPLGYPDVVPKPSTRRGGRVIWLGF
jgi:nitroreductase